MADQSNQIHESAALGEGVSLGKGNIIEARAIIEDGVKLGDHNTVGAGAYLCRGTQLGHSNRIHMYAVIGHAPQDLAYDGAESFTTLGDHNEIREFATIHRGTKAGSTTSLGSHNYLMAYSHIAHNCQLGNHIILVNQASLTGYCVVEDRAFLSGMTGLHQFTRVGRLAMVSALSAVNKDIPPYVICGGRPALALGLNVVGMRRAGFSSEVRADIKTAYKLLYRSGLNVSQALTEIQSQCTSPEVEHFVKFIAGSKRGIIDAASGSKEHDSLQARKENRSPVT